jgi:hypothetical protein
VAESEITPASDLFIAIFSIFCTMVFLQTSIIPGIVIDSLVSSDLVRSTSYSKTFPALHSLEDYENGKVIAIGSSIFS